MSEVKLNKLQQRREALFNPLYLSEILGYDFHKVAHGLELIHTVGPTIRSVEPLSVEPIPLFDLDPKKNQLVLWSRGHFKTSAVALYVVQLILAYPDIRILLMQATVKNTRGLLREIKSHFDGTNSRSRLDKLFPDWCKDTRLGTADGFVSPARKRTHLKEWTVAVASPKSVKTGQHYDCLFADDLVTDVNFRSKEQQEKTIEDFNLYQPLIEPGGYKTVTGTRYSFADLYGHIIRMDAERREWNISIRTCWKEGERKNGVLFPQVKTDDNRTIGFTEDLLDKIRADDPATFSCQYLNQPLIAGNQLFTEPMLMGAIKNYPANQHVMLGPATLFIDLAASQRAESDHSVVLCGRMDGMGQMYVTDLRAGRFSPMQLAHATLEMALLHRPNSVRIEGTAAGNYFIEYLRMIAAGKGMVLYIEPIRVNNTKDAKHLRIASLEGVIKARRLFFLTGLPGWEDIVEQFTTFPRGRHDDEIDTISLMVQFYTANTNVYTIPRARTLFDSLLDPSHVNTVATPEPTDVETCGSHFIG
jgi:predicted phage terminase large subunit-like protein